MKGKRKILIMAGLVLLAVIIIISQLYGLFAIPGLQKKSPGGNNSTASLIAMVSIRGKFYEAVRSPKAEIIPGKKVATVEVFTGETFQRSKEEYEELKKKVYSTIVPQGGEVYALADYDPEFRVCAKSSYGNEFIVFQRRFDDSLTGNLSKYINLNGKIKSIILTDNYPDEKGRIDDPQEISRLEKLLMAEVSLSGQPWGNSGTITERLNLELKDGTNIEGALKDGRLYLGTWVELPKEFVDALHSISLSEGGVPKNAMGGGLVASREYEDRTGINDAYIDAIDNNSLYCSGDLWLGNRTLAAAGPVSEVQGSPGKLWYITAAGNVECIQTRLKDLDEYFLTFKGPKSSPSKDFRDYADKTTAYSDNAKRIRVMKEQLIILSSSGLLSISNETIAEGVNLFDIDHSGIIYTDKSGLYRFDMTGKKLTRLAASDSITSISSAGHSVCWSTPDGIFTTPSNGGNIRKISNMSAEKLICNGDGNIGAIEKGSQALWLISFAGEGKLIRDKSVVDFGFAEANLLLTVEKQADGSLEMYRITLPQPGADLLSRTYLLTKF